MILEVRAILLQFTVVHVNCIKLVLVSWTQFVPGLRVVLAIPADIRVSQAQTSKVHHGHSCTTPNKDEERDESWVMPQLFADCREHFDCFED